MKIELAGNTIKVQKTLDGAIPVRALHFFHSLFPGIIMFGEVDDMCFDMDVLSSPIVEREYSNPEFSFADMSQPQFELQSYSDMLRPPTQEQFQFDAMSFDLKKPAERQQKVQDVLKPKPKREALVFHPFASFEATELTVKSLMKRSNNNAIVRL